MIRFLLTTALFTGAFGYTAAQLSRLPARLVLIALVLTCIGLFLGLAWDTRKDPL